MVGLALTKDNWFGYYFHNIIIMTQTWLALGESNRMESIHMCMSTINTLNSCSLCGLCHDLDQMASAWMIYSRIDEWMDITLVVAAAAAAAAAAASPYYEDPSIVMNPGLSICDRWCWCWSPPPPLVLTVTPGCLLILWLPTTPPCVLMLLMSRWWCWCWCWSWCSSLCPPSDRIFSLA